MRDFGRRTWRALTEGAPAPVSTRQGFSRDFLVGERPAPTAAALGPEPRVPVAGERPPVTPEAAPVAEARPPSAPEPVPAAERPVLEFDPTVASPDHIYPLKRIIQEEGFSRLTPAQQQAIVELRENYMANTPTDNKPADLQSLPRWLQYLIALVVIAVVVAAAMWTRGGEPPPEWIIRYLAPALGWLYILLCAVWLIRYLRRR